MNDWIFFNREEVDCAEYVAVMRAVNAAKEAKEAGKLAQCCAVHVAWIESELSKQTGIFR